MLRLPKIRNRQRSRGQSVVEFAMIAPVLVFLLLITLDFGRLFMSYITLTNTTRVAANYAAVNPGSFTGTPNTTIYDAIIARESAGLNCEIQDGPGGHNPPIPTFIANGLGKQTGLGATAVAAMTCDFTLLTPFITNFFGGPLPISASAEYPIHVGAIANIGGGTSASSGIPDRCFRLHWCQRRNPRRFRQCVRRRHRDGGRRQQLDGRPDV